MKTNENVWLNSPLPDGYLLKDYELLHVIGRGGFSIVYLAKHLRNGNIVAIKEYMPNSLPLRKTGAPISFKNEALKKFFMSEMEDFFREISIIAHLNHPNLIRTLDYFEANQTAYIVMPYETGVSLGQYIGMLLNADKQVNQHVLKKICIDLLSAIHELHSCGLLHLDIHPSNILLRQNNELLILDFGTSIDKAYKLTDIVRTTGFAAPEQYRPSNIPDNAEYHYKVGTYTDYYGIGATLYGLLARKPPKDVQLLCAEGGRIDVWGECDGEYHYEILNAVYAMTNPSKEERKQINLPNIIRMLSGIIPFSIG